MRIRRKKTYNPTMIDLIVGIIFCGIVGLALFVGLHFLSVPLESLFDDSIWQIILGYIIGIIFSVFTIIHMTSSVESAVDMGEHGALKHTRIMYAVRMVALIAVFAIMLIFGIGNIFAMLFGLLSLKLSAYLQPITEKLRKGR